MTRFSKQTIENVKAQLTEWFDKQLPRGARINESEIIVDQESAVLAAKLYKRGGIIINGLAQAEPSLTQTRNTHVLHFESWNEFFSTKFPNCEMIIDKNVFSRIEMNKSFYKMFPLPHVLDCTEQNKNIDTVFSMANKILPSTRTIMSVGGGIASDVAGCVAGLVDCELLVVPTTWLAGVDAAIGGKNGVNHPVYGKNQIGLFLHPTKFYIVDEAFQTLSRAQFLCGFAEAIKHRWLAGDAKLANLAHLTSPISSPADFIGMHIEFKRTVVEKDPFERNLRKTLNLGHTYAHVIEALADQGYLAKIPHGAAVAFGLKIKASMQSDLPADFLNVLAFLAEAIAKEYPVTVLKPIDESVLKPLLLADKKRQGELISVVRVPYGLLSSAVNFDENSYLLEQSIDVACSTLCSFIFSR